MKKVVWSLSLVLAMPSMALGLERRDGAYYCTVKFAAGVAYNDALKQWEGSTFKPDINFVMKLSFRDPTRVPAESPPRNVDNYDVTITEEGSPDPTNCIGADGKPPSTTGFSLLVCNTLNGT